MRDNNIDDDVNLHNKFHQRESHRAHNKDKDEDKGQRQQNNYNDNNNNNHDNDDDNNDDDDNQRLKKNANHFFSAWPLFQERSVQFFFLLPPKTYSLGFYWDSLMCRTSWVTDHGAGPEQNG